MRIMNSSKIRFIASLGAFVGFAAGILFAQYDRGYYSQENPGSIMQSAPPRDFDNAIYSVAAFPLYPVDLAPGDGRDAVQAYCSTCHSTRYITMQPPLPPETWEAEVNKMVKIMGQPIPEDVQPVIIKYLQAHYTPASRKR
jgi:hypothetical protein